MKAIIHIGSGKTGTTSIQKSLFDASTKDEGFCFPTIFGRNNQNIDLFFKQNNKFSRGTKSKILARKLSKNDCELLFKDFSEQLSNDLILSSEYLFSFNSQEIEALKSFLSSRGYSEFMVILYLREPKSYFRSALQQKIKASSQIISPNNLFQGFIRRIEGWRALFPNFVIREFSSESLLKGDVVADFESQCSKFLNKPLCFNSRIENDSLSAEALFFLKKFNETTLSPEKPSFTTDLRQLLFAAQRLSGGFSKVTLTAAAKEAIDCESYELRKYLWTNFSLRFAGDTIDFNRNLPNPSKNNRNFTCLNELVEQPSQELLLDFSTQLVCELFASGSLISNCNR